MIGTSGASNYATPITVVPPAGSLPSLTDLGSQYSFCVHGERLFNDGADGCFTSGTSMYAYRQVFVQYPFAAGQNAAQTSIIINYNQYGPLVNSTSSAGNYNFELYACAVPPNSPPIPSNQPEPTSTSYFDTFPPTNVSTGPCASQNPTDITLPQEPSGTTSSSFQINNYSAGDSIELDWVNNVTSYLGDPNLEINSVQLNQQ